MLICLYCCFSVLVTLVEYGVTAVCINAVAHIRDMIVGMQVIFCHLLQQSWLSALFVQYDIVSGTKYTAVRHRPVTILCHVVDS